MPVDVGDIDDSDARRPDVTCTPWTGGQRRRWLGSEEIRKISHPCTELSGGYSGCVVHWVREQAEDASGEELCN